MSASSRDAQAMSLPPVVASLQRKAQRIRREQEEYRRAREACAEETAALLEPLCTLLAPVLPYLTGPLVGAGLLRRAGMAGQSHEEREPLRVDGRVVRGLLLAGDPGPRVELPDAAHGRMRGKGLWRLEDGRFLEVLYAGTWERGRDPERVWTAEARVVTAVEAGTHWRATAILDHLYAQFDGLSRTHATEGLRAQAERLRAVRVLLGGG